MLTEVVDRFDDISVVATREAERLGELADVAPVIVTVPSLDSDIHDLNGLLMLGDPSLALSGRLAARPSGTMAG